MNQDTDQVSTDSDPVEGDYPFAVTLRFASEEERRTFMGQLSDGWGESWVDLDWPWRKLPRNPDGSVSGFHDQPWFVVRLLDADEETS